MENYPYKYAVVSSFNFSEEVCVFPCLTEADAIILLRKFYDEETASDKECGFNSESEISEDGYYAKLTVHSRTGDDDITEFRVATIETPPHI